MNYKPEASEKPKVNLDKYDGFTKEVFSILTGLGLTITPTQKCPFEALTVDRDMLILTGLGKDDSKLREKARVVADISVVTGRESVIFIERVRLAPEHRRDRPDRA